MRARAERGDGRRACELVHSTSPTLLTALVLLLVTACGGTSDKATSTAVGPGVDARARTIRLGVITPLTGPVAVIGKPLTAGNEVWFRHVNEDLGGIGGRYKVELVEEDSQYVPQQAVQAYNKVKGGVVMIAQLLGTPVTKAVLPLLEQDGVVAAPASLDAEWVHEPNLLPVGAPYQVQMVNAADYLVHDAKVDRTKAFCTMVQDDAYGQAGQAGVDFAARELGFTIRSTARFPAGATELTAAVQQLKQAACDVVFLVSTPTVTSRALGTAAQLQFAPQWVGQSPSYSGSLARSPLAPYLQAHFLVASEGTEWEDRSVPGQAEMLDAIKRFKPDQEPDFNFTFGYNQANAVTQVLSRALADGDLSRQAILKAMEAVGTLTFAGLSGDYRYGKPADRQPPRRSTIFRVNPAKPTGLEKVKYDFESEAARRLTI